MDKDDMEADNLTKVTPEMTAAWVGYDPGEVFSSTMQFAQVIGVVRSAFYAGWLARQASEDRG